MFPLFSPLPLYSSLQIYLCHSQKRFSNFKDLRDYVGPTQTIQDKLSISRSLTLITPAKSLLSWKVTYLQVPETRMWTSVEGHCPAYHIYIHYLPFFFFLKKKLMRCWSSTTDVDFSPLLVSASTCLYIFANEFLIISSINPLHSYFKTLGALSPSSFWKLSHTPLWKPC